MGHYPNPQDCRACVHKSQEFKGSPLLGPQPQGLADSWAISGAISASRLTQAIWGPPGVPESCLLSCAFSTW